MRGTTATSHVRQASPWRRAIGATFAVIVALAATAATHAQDRTATDGKLPRFASLKASEVNLRRGPGTEYPTAWVFRRAGLPVEVLEEHEAWRQVRDADGTTGWVIRSLISGRRTAQVLPWEVKEGQARPQLPLHARASDGSGTVVMLEAGVIADVFSCDGTWCYIGVESFRGYIRQAKLWGVYAGELLE
ncbi:MAG: SH3 domain-containing protein [Hyphomicrobiaceae bacterium]|nr:SH3 domain-containing protein [Hyphomicrobiaceae bacterium]